MNIINYVSLVGNGSMAIGYAEDIELRTPSSGLVDETVVSLDYDLATLTFAEP